MTAQQPTVSIIGIGDDGLDAVPEAARKLILEAQLLAGNQRSLELVPTTGAKRIVIGADLEAVVAEINESGAAQAAVLVSGDPLFYGLARFLCERIGHDRCEIVPHVSSMQLAFARVKESWDEAYLTDLANHSLAAVAERIRTAEKVGLFTTEECGPAQVCEALLERRIDYFTVYVCENLGGRDERVTRGSVEEIAGQSFETLNVMVLVRDSEAPDRPRAPHGRSLFGNPDEVFVQSTPKHGLLTPAEVRAMALSSFFALDPVLFAAPATGGVFHSADGGSTWTPAGLADDVVHDLVWLGPFLYAAGEAGFYRSDDNGANWIRLSESPGRPSTLLFPLAPAAGLEAFLADHRKTQ